MPQLARIAIYPFKSFDPLRVDEAVVLPNGALQHDRQFALIDQSGKFINAKRTPAVHGLELVLDPFDRTLTARRRSDTEVRHWQIDDQRDDLQRWLSDYFSLDLRLIEEPEGGFPDDTEATGPTIISVASLQTVTDWFPGLTMDDVRRRFRANLEVEGVEPDRN
ncbi:MAG: MOSC N-terminal beta barrel domain-containing protein, partial [Planctomycetota bacterium]